jgi:hypothetical protein
VVRRLIQGRSASQGRAACPRTAPPAVRAGIAGPRKRAARGKRGSSPGAAPGSARRRSAAGAAARPPCRNARRTRFGGRAALGAKTSRSSAAPGDQHRLPRGIDQQVAPALRSIICPAPFSPARSIPPCSSKLRIVQFGPTCPEARFAAQAVDRPKKTRTTCPSADCLALASDTAGAYDRPRSLSRRRTMPLPGQPRQHRPHRRRAQRIRQRLAYVGHRRLPVEVQDVHDLPLTRR